MSTDSADTDIAHLFAPDNAAPSRGEANPQSSEQPAPPDVVNPEQPFSQDPQQPNPQSPGQGQQDQQLQQQPRQVPLSELIDERKRRQSAEEFQRNQQQRIDQLEQMMARFTQPQQPQQPAPDFYDDPDAFARQLMHQVDQRFLNMSLNESERRARSEFGSESVDAAFDAAKRSGFSQAFVNRPDAYGDMVRWHKAQQLQETVGNDPAAYEARMKEQIRQQVIAEMRQGTPPPSNLPPSLSGATNVNPAANPAIVGSDKDFFNEMMNRKRG